MASANLNTLRQTAYPVLPDEYIEPRWYAVYTCANHEMRVATQLGEREVEHFLPLYRSVRRWKDRRVELELPLFPGYVFVHVALSNRLRVLQVPGVVRLVGFDGHPVPVLEGDVTRIREFLDQGHRAEPHPYLEAGRRVRVVSGPLEGMEGVILRRKNGSRLVISFALLQRAVAVELEALEVGPVFQPGGHTESNRIAV